ncbi:hypothetical protein BKI52_32730 [marine bacterium AO1-C]|nr:hypothetical protein BKI52_32730 [marine bacterium AO1-C]
MVLIKKSQLIDESSLKLNAIKLEKGSGVFLVEGAQEQQEKTIKVYYHKPKGYTTSSRVLMVIPGAGRNGDSYRDAWIETSEKYNVLILSPKFGETNYSFEDYHMGGLIKESNLRACIKRVKNTNIVTLNEDRFSYRLNLNQAQWIFKDLDRIFDLVAKATKSTQTNYDLFGHSAGGQILHRLAIFSPSSKVNHIIASNAGFYTLPDFNSKMPFGIQNTGIQEKSLHKSFAKKLTLLIGALDNETETGGTLLRSATVDQQGTHRLARAHYFYKFSKAKAKEISAEFRWKIQIVPNVGHNHRKMGKQAAKLLYQ